MIDEISILIPSYNVDCRKLFIELARQASLFSSYEIIVAEDGSTSSAVVSFNSSVSTLPNCRHIVRTVNVGRAAIRNVLASEARYEWLLFIDSDMSVIDGDFLKRYHELSCDVSVVQGGYKVVGDKSQLASNLRFLYECRSSEKRTLLSKNPYRDFHTSNFLISRQVMLQYPLDERFRRYGYEDVLMGKTLRLAGVHVCHIDNPVGFASFEDNCHFMAKTEEGLRTLREFREDLRGYSRILTISDGIHLPIAKSFCRLVFKLFATPMRRLLCSTHPSLMLFNAYKIGYYLCLEEE